MECVSCGRPSEEEHCPECSSGGAPSGPDLPSRDPAAEGAASGRDAPRDGTLAPDPSTADLGARIGRRYEIVRLLGRGGMGSVYLARDHALGRDVALKLVASHLVEDPGIAARFKREIQLSSIVTHPNVLRVYDLGEADGLRFLTMQYIDGETLADLMKRERPLGVDRALELFRQVCEGLAAAHARKVLHRDLKPQNVLVDREGHVYLTDFGLAKSTALETMTRAGALMGTPQYMSPEQVKGLPVDARSDVFSLGVVLHEMLAGGPPYSGDTLFELMMARTRAPPRAARELNPEVQPWLQRLLDRCLAVEPALRYGSVEELLRDLGDRKVRGGAGRAVAWGRRLRRGALVAAGVLGVALAGGLAARLWQRPGAPPATRTVLVADFENRTGEQLLTGTLEPALGLALEGAAFIAPLNRASAQRVADRMKLQGTGLGEARARLVAQREGASIVTSGFVENEGRGYRLGLRAVDAFTGQRLMEESREVAGKGEILGAVTALAARLRAVLGDRTPEGVQLKEAETFGASSLEAAHEYAVGMRLQHEGKYEEARSRYAEALKLDPEMGRAWAALAVMDANRSRHAEAERGFREALARVGRMTEREKHRTRGAYYLFARDADKAIEAYEALVRQYPADTAGHANLALGYVWRGDFARALVEGRRAIEIYPSNVPQRNNVGLFAMYVGEFEEAIREQERVLEQNPEFAAGHIGLALARLAAGHPDAAAEGWKRLEPLDGSAAAEGLADLAVFEGRLGQARALLEAGARADLAAKAGDAAGRKLAMLAEVRAAGGRSAAAVAEAERALSVSEDTAVLFTAGAVLAEAGKERRALEIADTLDRRVGAAPRSYAEVLRAHVDLRRGAAPDAVTHAKAAVERLDSWLARFALARAYLEAGAPAQAQEELERCVKRRGEVTDAFVDTVPTYRLFPPALYWLGRANEALRNPAAAAEAYRALLVLRRGGEDPLTADARKRLGGG